MFRTQRQTVVLALCVSLAMRAGTALGASPVLYWEVSPALRCPTQAQLRHALEAHLPADLSLRHGNPGTNQRGLYVGSGPTETLHVWLWMAPEETHRDRELRLEGVPCAQRAEAIALVADAWLKALPSTGDQSSTRARSPADTLSMGATASPPPTAPPPPTSTAAEMISVRSPTGASEGIPKRGFALELRGGVLGVFGLDAAAPGIGGALALDFWINRYAGFGTQLEFASNLVQGDPTVAGAQLTISRQALSIYGTFRPSPTRLAGLTVLAGPQLQRLQAHSSGFLVNGGETVFPVAIWAATTYRWEIARRVELFGELEGSVGFSEQYFFVTGPPGPTRTLITTPAVSMGLLMGVVVNLL